MTAHRIVCAPMTQATQPGAARLLARFFGDTACHRGNSGAWRFCARLGYRPLDEERIALLL